MSAPDLALVVIRLAIGCWLLWSVPRLTRPPGAARGRAHDRALADVAVVVPARDEEASLPMLLASVPTGVEVVVVDDDSTDRTAAVAAESGARVIEAGPAPEGWFPKPWACAEGAATAGSSRLVFADADVRFAPDGLAAVVDRVAVDGGLVSVQPAHHPVRAVEHLAMLFNIVGFAGTDAASPLGRRRGSRGAFGPVLATSRTDLDAAGGHAAARGSVVEDIVLAERYRASGRPVQILAGGDLVSFRMYPQGLGQLVEGFTKNMAAGAAAVRASTSLLVLAWLTLLVQASVAPFRALLTGQSAVAVASGVALYAVVAAQLWWMGRPLGRFAWWVPAAFPVSVLLFLAVFVRSVVAQATGRVTWRGRRLPVR